MLNLEKQTYICNLAKEHGFTQTGFCDAIIDPREQARLLSFVQNGEHGTMEWMEKTLQRRLSPQNMWENAKTAIVVAMNYAPESNPLDDLKHKDHGVISVYARGDDYHEIIKKRLKAIARDIANLWNVDVKVFVDTAPLMEKPLAAKTLIGWQGKHTNLISRELGNWFFLGVILTDMKLPQLQKTVSIGLDKQQKNNTKNLCGTCTLCLDICPTNAFIKPYQLNAKACISYLTIEHQGIIPIQYREAIGNRIFGCDDCLAVCPWNKFSKKANEQKLYARNHLKRMSLAKLLQLSHESFRETFHKSPVKRTGYTRFIRNVLIAAGNSNSTALIHLIIPWSKHDDEAVASSAIWALKKLTTSKQFKILQKEAIKQSLTPIIKSEWTSTDPASP